MAESSFLDGRFLERATKAELRTLLDDVLNGKRAAYTRISVDRGDTLGGALQVLVADASAAAKHNVLSALDEVTAELVDQGRRTNFEDPEPLSEALLLLEMLLGENLSINNSPILDSLIDLAERSEGDLRTDAIRVLSQSGSLRAISTLSLLHEKSKRRAEVAPALLLAKTLHDPLTAFEFKITGPQWRKLAEYPDFMLALERSIENMFTADSEAAHTVLVRHALKWPLHIKELAVEVLEDGLIYRNAWAKKAAKQISGKDTSAKIKLRLPDQKDIKQLSATRRKSISAASLSGIAMGIELFGKCGGAVRGERRFTRSWKKFLVSGSPQEAGRAIDRMTYMTALKTFRENKMRSDFNAVRNILRKDHQDPNFSVLRKVLGYEQGLWGKAKKTLLKLESLVKDAVEEQWKDDIQLPLLFIGVSRYHEEAIAAQIAMDLCEITCDYNIFDRVYSPWGERTVVGNHDSLNGIIGGADIRFTNLGSGDGSKPNKDHVSDPLFRHRGYRAYSEYRWLRDLGEQSKTPAAVRSWITTALLSAPGDLSAYTAQSLPERAWITLHGRPTNYPGTEFPTLFSYLNRAVSDRYPRQRIATASKSADPDKAFEQFILGQRGVLMSGSIHDMLLEEFWVPYTKDFIPLLTPKDFAPLYADTKAELGLNSIAFSPRLAPYGDIRKQIHSLFSTVFEVLHRIARDSETHGKQGILEYLAEALLDGQHETNTPTSDPKWSFVGSRRGLIRLLIEEMELAKNPPLSRDTSMPSNVIKLRRA